MITYIISDEYKDAVKTKTIIDNYMMNFDIEVKYHLFSNIDENIKNEIKNIKGFKVYILNNDSLKGNGINIAEYIRGELDDWNSIILLVTNHRELENEFVGKRLFLFDLITKNCFYEKILKEDLRRILMNYNNREKCLTFESNRIIKKLDFRNIAMITKEKDSKKCVINSSLGDYYTSESLKDVCKRLDSRFIKINRGCIINSDKVIEYNTIENKLTLKNGITSYDISRDNKKALSSKIYK